MQEAQLRELHLGEAKTYLQSIRNEKCANFWVYFHSMETCLARASLNGATATWEEIGTNPLEIEKLTRMPLERIRDKFIKLASDVFKRKIEDKDVFIGTILIIAHRWDKEPGLTPRQRFPIYEIQKLQSYLYQLENAPVKRSPNAHKRLLLGGLLVAASISGIGQCLSFDATPSTSTIIQKSFCP